MRRERRRPSNRLSAMWDIVSFLSSIARHRGSRFHHAASRAFVSSQHAADPVQRIQNPRRRQAGWEGRDRPVGERRSAPARRIWLVFTCLNRGYSVHCKSGYSLIGLSPALAFAREARGRIRPVAGAGLCVMPPHALLIWPRPRMSSASRTRYRDHAGERYRAERKRQDAII